MRPHQHSQPPHGSPSGPGVTQHWIPHMACINSRNYPAITQHAPADRGMLQMERGGGFDYTTAASLKIGRYMPITMPPTTMPMKIMISGSIRLLSASTALFTSSS